MELIAAAAIKMHILWIEQAHPALGYYDAVQAALVRRGHNVSEWKPRRGGISMTDALQGRDVALVGFGWFMAERGALPRLPAFERSCTLAPSMPNASSTPRAERAAKPIECACGIVPLVVMVNKEYIQMREKLAWLRAHCVRHALTVHREAPPLVSLARACTRTHSTQQT